MKSKLLGLPLLLCLSNMSACRTVDGSSSGLRAGNAIGCEDYPLVLDEEPSAEAAAEKVVSVLTEGDKLATLEWSEAYHTPKSVNNIGKKIECAQGDEVSEKILAFLGSHPDLFRIDASEWNITQVDCAQIKESPRHTFLSFFRKTFGSESVEGQKLTVVVFGTDRGFEIQMVTGNYLPSAKNLPLLVERMKSCPTLSDAELVEAVRAIPQPLPFMILNQCTPIGPGSYSIKPSDKVSVLKKGAWQAMGNSQSVKLSRVASVELELTASSITNEIKSSDLYCDQSPKPSFAGFDLSVDDVKGDVVGLTSGIRSCHVCLK